MITKEMLTAKYLAEMEKRNFPSLITQMMSQ